VADNLKKLVFIFTLLTSHLWADGITDRHTVRQEFIATDGDTYYLRAASSDDIDNPLLDINERFKEGRKSRAVNGYYGLFIIEKENGNLVDELCTDRMPLWVQPYQLDHNPKDDRLEIIIKFYDWLLNLHGIEPAHSDAVRNENIPGKETPIVLINNTVHAATVAIPENGLSCIVAIQNALAKLAQRINLQVAPDADITPAGTPTFIISTSKVAPTVVTESNTRIFVLPYCSGASGFRYTIVTSMADINIPELPVELTQQIDTYTSRLNS
jgi:hypothetical protein